MFLGESTFSDDNDVDIDVRLIGIFCVYENKLFGNTGSYYHVVYDANRGRFDSK